MVITTGFCRDCRNFRQYSIKRSTGNKSRQAIKCCTREVAFERFTSPIVNQIHNRRNDPEGHSRSSKMALLGRLSVTSYYCLAPLPSCAQCYLYPTRIWRPLLLEIMPLEFIQSFGVEKLVWLPHDVDCLFGRFNAVPTCDY